MYKRFTIDELKNIQSNFLKNIHSIMNREKILSFKDFIKNNLKYWDNCIYYYRWEPTFRIKKAWNDVFLADEKEKIEIYIKQEDISKMQSLVTKYITRNPIQYWKQKNKIKKKTMWKSIPDILSDEIKKWKYWDILWKKYLVYDIETTSNIQDLTETKFLLAYFLYPWKNNEMIYKYVSDTWDYDMKIKEFADFLLNFDWYIIWFNSVAFDNPVTMYNAWYWEKEINKINEKSIDIFLFIRNVTWKRIWLNKLSKIFIWFEKTLESGAEWETLRNKYLETNDKKYLNKFKEYCKNDVRMTTYVLLYLLHFKKLYLDDKEIIYSIEEFVKKSKEHNSTEKTEQTKIINQKIF